MNQQPKTAEPPSAAPVRWSALVRPMCPTCEQRRVPQYDIELKCAESAVREWKEMAERLFKAMGCRQTEWRRRTAEEAYRNLVADYERWRLHGPNDPN